MSSSSKNNSIKLKAEQILKKIFIDSYKNSNPAIKDIAIDEDVKSMFDNLFKKSKRIVSYNTDITELTSIFISAFFKIIGNNKVIFNEKLFNLLTQNPNLLEMIYYVLDYKDREEISNNIKACGNYVEDTKEHSIKFMNKDYSITRENCEKISNNYVKITRSKFVKSPYYDDFSVPLPERYDKVVQERDSTERKEIVKKLTEGIINKKVESAKKERKTR